MQPKVFISHSSKDKAIADAICHQLESEGIKCWIAPRDIEPGSKWTEAIMRGIEKCRAFVLVVSANANDSEQVQREVAKAFSLQLPVIPFRCEAVMPNRSLGYFLQTVQWLGNAQLLSSLGVVDALLGHKEAAISEAERAVEILPISKDALIGSAIVTNLAAVYAWNDELDQAFATLNPLTKMPYGIYYGQMKLDPYWEPLRKDPRFDKLLTELGPKD